MGVPKWKKEAEKRYVPDNYYPTKEQENAALYCIRNNIRISPVACLDNRVGSWQIGISTPDDYKKIYRSPEICDKHSVMEVYYKYCLYYYEKSI